MILTADNALKNKFIDVCKELSVMPILNLSINITMLSPLTKVISTGIIPIIKNEKGISINFIYFIKETAGFEIMVNPAKKININILTNTLFKIKHKKSIVKVNITFANGSFFASFEEYAYLSVTSKIILLF